jgi:hypothetical protein
VQVLADAVRSFVDPARNVGLTYRNGQAMAVHNDGTMGPVTKAYLMIDALKGFDAAFEAWAAANPKDAGRQPLWRDARSQLVDTFLSISGKGATSDWANPAVPAVLPALLDALHAQILAHCPDRSSAAKCTWATTDLTKNLSDVVSGPTFAAVVDLVDAIRSDDHARTELEKLLAYLLDVASSNETEPAVLAATVDMMQILSDDTNLTPLFHAIADAAGGSLVADNGKTVNRALLDAIIETLSRVFAHAADDHGAEICAKEVDPNGAIASVLKNFVTPMAPDQPAPIEVLIDVIADVNRADPHSTAKLAPGDYANIANEISDFCMDKASGLEQVYEVIREATLPAD